MRLIVDSGSSKTSWCMELNSSSSLYIETPGINPVRDEENVILRTISTAANSFVKEICQKRNVDYSSKNVNEIFFYGAGCISPYSNIIKRCLSATFSVAYLTVESDLLGAARALCGHREGIACIMGTGSNSCLYDGEKIVKHVSPLGWILGDEGSGAVLGRLFVGKVLKRQLCESLCDRFMQYHKLTEAAIIERVYRQPQPNRFLASFVPFISSVQNEEEVHSFLVSEFRRFFSYNVLPYNRSDLPVNFVGGVASAFENVLREAAEKEGLVFGSVEKTPIAKIYQYHCGEQ